MLLEDILAETDYSTLQPHYNAGFRVHSGISDITE